MDSMNGSGKTSWICKILILLANQNFLSAEARGAYEHLLNNFDYQNEYIVLITLSISIASLKSKREALALWVLFDYNTTIIKLRFTLCQFSDGFFFKVTARVEGFIFAK